MQINTSLIQAQRDALIPILKPEIRIPWKILCYDSYCEKRLSTIYRVGDLREMCITLHFNLDQNRERLHGVTAIYFIQPLQSSIEKLVEDFNRDLYSEVYINFSSPIENNLLEMMAKEISKISGAVQKIQKVYEHNLDFVALNHNFFNLENQVVTGLFSIIMALKVQPLILFQKNSKIEQIAKELIEKLKQLEFNSDYPLLAIILPDRDIDLNTLIMHSNTYGALLHDTLNIKYNKVKLDDQVYDLSPQYDNLWLQACNMALPEAIDKIDNELNDWNSQYQQVSQQNQEISSALNAIDLVPQMNQQKKMVDSHINLAKQLTQIAKQKSLDKFYQLGQSILQNDTLTINDYPQSEDNQIEQSKEIDKLRLLILMLLNNYNQQEFKKFEQIFQIKNEKYLNILSNFKQRVASNQNNKQQSVYKSLFAAITSKMPNSGKGLLKNVQNFLLQRGKKSAIVQMLENLFLNELKIDELQSILTMYDSRVKNISRLEFGLLSTIKGILICFTEGACYNEYAELSDFAKSINKVIIYGGNKIYNAEEFLTQFQ
ncbi:unnamed protein product [Paramecium pentaurelia]|uniref:Sec1 family protein n=1 Tax=Paramecium pentaurelia TaxID=43138 RepID=A0A8S1WEI5_9CILI|nr:unnamed protein product [Paramecium pentaurelia]